MFASAEDKFIVSTNVNFFLDFFISVLYLLDLKGKKKTLYGFMQLFGGFNCFQQI